MSVSRPASRTDNFYAKIGRAKYYISVSYYDNKWELKNNCKPPLLLCTACRRTYNLINPKDILRSSINTYTRIINPPQVAQSDSLFAALCFSSPSTGPLLLKRFLLSAGPFLCSASGNAALPDTLWPTGSVQDAAVASYPELWYTWKEDIKACDWCMWVNVLT